MDCTDAFTGAFTNHTGEDQLMEQWEQQIRQRIAVLESHQDGRRAHIAETEKIIARKQLVIDNLRAQLPPTPQQRAQQLWGLEPASCE